MYGVKQNIKWLSSNTTIDLENQFDEFFQKNVAGILEVTPLIERKKDIIRYMILIRYIKR